MTQSALSADAELKIYRQTVAAAKELEANGIPAIDQFNRLKQLHDELHQIYSTKKFNCPRVRFGRTEISMPIITCGGMRLQETWSPTPSMTLADIKKDCQENLKQIVERSLDLGINHFETARGYGTSETQFGPILKSYPRDSYILQSKCAPKENVDEFRAILEKTFNELQLTDGGYLDLFSFHGINTSLILEWVMKPGGCLEVVREYQRLGKIKFIGFSTHGITPVVVEAIETGVFDYVNLHYHFIGSYTSTGTGNIGGNLEAIQAAKRHDMGVFIISPADKGGALYNPSKAFFRDCLPLSPIVFNSLWLWSQDHIHTIVVGAARPTDFDESIQAAMLYDKRFELIKPIEEKLKSRVISLFGENFLETWFLGLPDAYSNDECIPVSNLFWLWWLVKAWGLHQFAVNRYANLESAAKTFDDSKPIQEKQNSLNTWVPGVSYRPEREDKLREVLADHPRKEYIIDAIKQLHQWVHSGGCFKRGEEPIGISPSEYDSWHMAYDLQPQKPYPER